MKYEILHYESFSFPFQFINFYKWEKDNGWRLGNHKAALLPSDTS